MSYSLNFRKISYENGKTRLKIIGGVWGRLADDIAD